MRRLSLALVVGAVAWTGLAAAKAPIPFARDERVTFFGDSITTHNYFTYQLEFIDALRNADHGMETISRGRAGDTAHGGFSRWDWDAANVPSDRVFVMFGMNDIGRGDWMDEKPSADVAARRQKSLDVYAEYTRKLADKILASGRRLVLVTPSPFDQYGSQKAANIPYCNDPGLATCAKIVRRLADEKGLELVDLHRPMSKFLQEHPEFGLLERDRVHPDGKGGLLMAVMILEQMGVLPYADETSFDAKGRDKAAFDYRPRHLPYPRTSDYLKVNGAYGLDGRLIREIVKIANLPTGSYELKGAGKTIGTFTSDELAKGVDLALYETPSMEQAKKACRVFSNRRGNVQRNRRLVSGELVIRNAGGDPEDEAAAKAAIARRRAQLDKNPKARHYAYYTGQLDFWEQNHAQKKELWAKTDAMFAELRAACRPAAWRLEVAAVAREKPLLRIGAMTDDHLHASRPETHRRAKACFELFRKFGVDIVVDTGDIADKSDVSELRLFRQMFDEAFAGTDCVPFFCIANHDYNYVPHTKKNDPVNFENARKALGMPSVNPTAVVKGYRFVCVHQCEPKKNAFAEAVARAVAENEGNRPVFVVNHVPPMLTTTSTAHWSSRPIRDVLNRYPQVVALTGHIHTSIKWPGNIWQGEFTSVSLGAHAEYSNPIAGEATVLDVFADRIDIRRYEAASGREIGAEDRWSFPLPHDPARGPYRASVREKTCPVPAMPAAAAVRYEQTGASGRLIFPHAEPMNAAKAYRLFFESQADDGTWRQLSRVNWGAPQTLVESATWEAAVSPALLDGARPHRVTIKPVNSLGVVGRGGTYPLSVPPNPMTELPEETVRVARYQRSDGKVFRPEADGWFVKNCGQQLVVLPKAFAAALAEKKDATLVFDVASDQPERPNTFSIGKLPASGGELELGIGARAYTLPGKTDANRYVWKIGRGKNPSPEDEFCLVIREGDNARFRINGVKCYVK